MQTLTNANPIIGITPETLKTKAICEIADIIYKDHRKQGKRVDYAAAPYVSAMQSLGNIGDKYGLDDGRSIVAYALNNLQTWRGDTARIVKAELKRRMK